MEESPCESKHGEGGPRRWLGHPLAAPAAAGRRVREREEQGGARVQNKTLRPAPRFYGSRLRAETPVLRRRLRPNQKFRPRPAPTPKDGIGLV